MTDQDKMPFGKYGPRREGGALTLKDVKEKYPDYVRWLLQQEGFAQKNPILYAYFTEGEQATARPEELKVLDLEKQLLATAPAEFKDWWSIAYGERLRKDGKAYYIPYLRVALQAWISSAVHTKHRLTLQPKTQNPPAQKLPSVLTEPLTAPPDEF